MAEEEKFIGSNVAIDDHRLSVIFNQALCDFYGDSNFTVEVIDVNQGDYSADLLVNIHYPNNKD